MVTQFVLRSDKKGAAGRCPVHLVVYFDGARLKCATGEKCKPADWNADKQKFRASYPLAEEANNLLKLMAGHVLAWWRYAKVVEDLRHNTMRRIWKGQVAATESAGAQSSQIARWSLRLREDWLQLRVSVSRFAAD